MINKLAKKNCDNGLRLVAFQFFIAFIISVIFTVFLSVKSGYSALAGGITFILPNLIFVLMAFAHAGASKSKLIVRGFFAGEAIKILITVILLSVFLKYGSLSLTAFYISFALLIASQWFAPFFFNYNNGMKNDR